MSTLLALQSWDCNFQPFPLNETLISLSSEALVNQIGKIYIAFIWFFFFWLDYMIILDSAKFDHGMPNDIVNNDKLTQADNDSKN